MNTNITKIGIFIAGVGIGALGTYLALKEKYARIANDEIASVREHMGRTDRRNLDKNGVPLKSAYREPKNPIPASDEYHRIVRKYQGDGDPHNAYLDPAELEHPPEGDEDDYRECEKMSNEANYYAECRAPYVITTEQFAEEMEHYDKLTIYYYDKDDTLTDENEEIITDVAAIIGDIGLSSFGDEFDEPEVVYVRNEKMEIDYEVIYMHKSYSETVLGVVPNDSAHNIRRRGAGGED
jgi:hypothetical protein